jgi:hypothetical protein
VDYAVNVIVAPHGGGAGARPPVVPVLPVLPAEAPNWSSWAEGSALGRRRAPDWSWADGPGLRAGPVAGAADGPRRAPLARASMAAPLTMIDEKQDKALVERTLKKHHLVRANGGGVDRGLGGNDGRQVG